MSLFTENKNVFTNQFLGKQLQVQVLNVFFVFYPLFFLVHFFIIVILCYDYYEPIVDLYAQCAYKKLQKHCSQIEL